MGYCSVYIYWGCSFLDSNLLQTLIVFITGLFVIIIYALQKRNEKQKITKLLLSEIYLAEKTIANLLSQGTQIKITNFFFLMPNNSRKDHGHIFMKEFDANEIEMINEFFNKCSYLEKEIQTSLSYINIAMEEKSRITQQKLLELADKHGGNTTNPNLYEQEKKRILDDIYYKEISYFSPHIHQDRIISILPTIRNLSGTTIMKKLKKIGNL